jgi:MFS family permease
MALGTISAGLIEFAGWRNTFYLYAVLYAGLSLLGAVVIVRPKTYEAKGFSYEEKQVQPWVMVKQKDYLLTFAWITVLVSGYLVISGHAALCLLDIGASPYLAAFSIGLVSVSNVVSRILISALYRKTGAEKLQYSLTFLGIFSSMVCLSGYKNAWLMPMLAGYTILGFLNGGCTIVINAYIMNEFGNENFAMNMAITNIHLAIASLLGPAVAGYLKTSFGSYTPAFIVMILFGLCSLVLLFVNKKSNQKADAV